MSSGGQGSRYPEDGSSFGHAVDRLSDDLIDRMRARLPSQSKEAVIGELGISSNTWTKLKRGEPIRRSIADRLMWLFGDDHAI
jgi:hypothetical protein